MNRKIDDFIKETDMSHSHHKNSSTNLSTAIENNCLPNWINGCHNDQDQNEKRYKIRKGRSSIKICNHPNKGL